jgi:hypothetical protein
MVSSLMKLVKCMIMSGGVNTQAHQVVMYSAG